MNCIYKTEIIEWLQREFSPLKLATPEPTISQIVENTIRYWNTHSAHPIIGMYNVNLSVSTKITLTPEFKGVHGVLPNANPEWIYTNHPFWTLLGVTILDNVTTDLIEMASAYTHYKTYIGNDFKFKFVPSQDPEVAPYVLFYNFPPKATKACIIGVKRIIPNEDIKQEHILNWVLRYSRALLKQAEGNLLRKAKLINAEVDGQQIYDEGKEEKKELEDELGIEGRWIMMGASRF